MSIDTIKAQINGHAGLATPDRFACFIEFPIALIGAFLNSPLLLCTTEMTQLPGRQIATTPQFIYGVQRKMPYGVLYEDLPITFICTTDMAARQIFDQWQSVITDPTNNFFNYYDDYTGNIVLMKRDEQNNVNYVYVLEEVYPITIEAQEMNYGAVDEHLRLTVLFAYRRWRTVTDLTIAAVTGGGAFPSIINDVLANPEAHLNILPPISANSPFTPENIFNIGKDLANDAGDGLNTIFNTLKTSIK